MDITLNQDEIEAAVREFIGTQGISISNKSIEISLTAGRGANGHSASITILPLKPGGKVSKPKAKDPVVKDFLEEATTDFKEQEPEGGFELTESGPIEPEGELELADGAPAGETDSLFGG